MRLHRWIAIALIPVAVSVLLAVFSAAAMAADYTPTQAEADEIQRSSERYLGHLDRGEYAEAHAMYSEEMRALAPFDEWRDHGRASRAAWGALERRDRANITWYLDPPNAPRPGLYVAVDYVSRYAGLAQHTEYLIWYRAGAGSGFELTRHETNAVDKPSAAKGAAHPGAAPGRIPYPNVETARTALLARDDIRRREIDGWLIIEVPTEYAIWSFTPSTHPAHPAMVLRAPIERDGKIVLALDVMCGAAKPTCDALVQDHKSLSARMAEEMQRSIREGRKP